MFQQEKFKGNIFLWRIYDERRRFFFFAKERRRFERLIISTGGRVAYDDST
jgi:hypothetical protein